MHHGARMVFRERSGTWRAYPAYGRVATLTLTYVLTIGTIPVHDTKAETAMPTQF